MPRIYVSEGERVVNGAEVYTCSLIVPYKFYILYFFPPGEFVWTTEPNLLENINLDLLRNREEYSLRERDIEEGTEDLERLINFFSNIENAKNKEETSRNLGKFLKILGVR